MKGISDIIGMLILLLVTIALAGMAAVFIFGTFTSKTRSISLIDAYCIGTTGSAIISNVGPDVIRASEQTLVDVDEACTDPSMVDIPFGGRVIYNFTSCTTARSHRYRLVGPSGSVEITFRCA